MCGAGQTPGISLHSEEGGGGQGVEGAERVDTLARGGAERRTLQDNLKASDCQTLGGEKDGRGEGEEGMRVRKIQGEGGKK